MNPTAQMNMLWTAMTCLGDQLYDLMPSKLMADVQWGELAENLSFKTRMPTTFLDPTTGRPQPDRRKTRFVSTRSLTCRIGRGARFVLRPAQPMTHIGDAILFHRVSGRPRLQRSTSIMHSSGHDAEVRHAKCSLLCVGRLG